MPDKKNAGDLMIDVFDYPHIPYWFSIRQAIGIIKKSVLNSEKSHNPIAILVFDEKYNLLGLLGLSEILKGVEPQLLKSGKESGWDALFDKESKKATERPVSEIMVPIKTFLSPGDPVSKAAYLMINNNLELLPVLEDNKKLVGVVRMPDIFDEITHILSEK